MSKISALRQKLKDIRYRRALRRIRAEMSSWGIKTDHLSDEELVERIYSVSRQLVDSGVTAKEAAEGFARFGRASKMTNP